MSTPLTLALTVERWPIAGSFGISRGSKTEALVVVAELRDGNVRGRGECVPMLATAKALIASWHRSMPCGRSSMRISTASP